MEPADFLFFPVTAGMRFCLAVVKKACHVESRVCVFGKEMPSDAEGNENRARISRSSRLEIMVHRFISLEILAKPKSDEGSFPCLMLSPDFLVLPHKKYISQYFPIPPKSLTKGCFKSIVPFFYFHRFLFSKSLKKCLNISFSNINPNII